MLRSNRSVSGLDIVNNLSANSISVSSALTSSGTCTVNNIKCTPGQMLRQCYNIADAYAVTGSAAATLTTSFFTSGVTTRTGLTSSQTNTTPGTTCDILPSTTSIISAVETYFGGTWAIGETFSIWLVNKTGGANYNWLVAQGDTSTILKNGAATFTMTGSSTVDRWYKVDVMRISSTQILLFHYNF